MAGATVAAGTHARHTGSWWQITHGTEPWEALLETGRADERLVHDDFYEARRPAAVLDPRRARTRRSQSALGERGHRPAVLASGRGAVRRIRGPTIVTTGTASGKSLCFQLPTLEVLTADRARARCTCTRPSRWPRTRRGRCTRFGLHKQIRPAIYDGDTPRAERAAIRKRSNLVLTNPDMLHVGILPHHPAWDELLANLAFVVVDEAHVYRGVFGSHVANVLRRLRRVAAIHGTAPRFLLASATIANPLELAERLTGLERLNLVDRDAAPQAEPPGGDLEPAAARRELGIRASALAEAAELFSELVAGGRPHDLLHEVAQGRRADPPPRPRPARRRARRADRPVPGRLHARSSARRSSAD